MSSVGEGGEVPEDVGSVFCPKCGRRAEPGDVYCASCGASLPELGSAPGRASWRQRLAGLIGRSRRERVVTAVTLVVVAAAVAAAIVLLTGSDDDASTYVGLADQACVTAEDGIAQVRDKVARGERDPAEALALESAAVAELVADWRSRVSRLDPPPDLAQRAAATEEALADLESAARGVAQLAPEASATRARGLAASLSAPARRLEDSIRALGLEECASDDRPVRIGP